MAFIILSFKKEMKRGVVMHAEPQMEHIKFQQGTNSFFLSFITVVEFSMYHC
jgi:hypothetical protein